MPHIIAWVPQFSCWYIFEIVTGSLINLVQSRLIGRAEHRGRYRAVLYPIVVINEPRFCRSPTRWQLDRATSIDNRNSLILMWIEECERVPLYCLQMLFEMISRFCHTIKIPKTVWLMLHITWILYLVAFFALSGTGDAISSVTIVTDCVAFPMQVFERFDNF